MQCARSVFYRHLWSARLYHIFQLDLINGTILEKNFLNIKICVLILSTTFVWNISHSKKHWARYDKKCVLFCRYRPVILVLFKRNLNVLYRFWKYAQISNVTKILPVGIELFLADGRTDMKKLIVAFRNFANAPKNGLNWFVMWSNRGAAIHDKVCCISFEAVQNT
jgi:hypothetical protein